MSRIIIYDNVLALREFQPTDLAPIKEWVNDPKTTQTLSDKFIYPKSGLEVDNYIKSFLTGESIGFVLGKASDTNDNNYSRYYGQINIKSIDQRNKKIDFSIVIHPNYRGHGYGTKAIKAFIHYAFFDLNMNKVTCSAMGFNKANKLYEDIGFLVEGILQDDYFF